jgi:hypothetical protein
MRNAYRYAQLGGSPHGTAASKLSTHSHRSAIGKPLSLVWCDSLLSLVLFRLMPPSLARSGGAIPSMECMVP